MICFEVSTNGQKKVKAGVGDLGSIHVIASWVVRDIEALRKMWPDSDDFVKEEMRLDVGGLDTPTGEFLNWFNEELNIGDEIHIRVLDDQNPDPPTHRKANTCMKPPEDQRRKMYEDLKKEFEPEA